MGFKTKWNRFWTLRNTEGGFTLVELIVVIAILAILAGVAVPAYTGYIKRAREAGDQLLIAAVNEAFVSSCLEAGVEMIEVTDAKISVSEQLVFGVSSVAGASDPELNVICSTFNQLFEGNFNTPFVTENVKSLDWVPEEASFKMDHEYSVASRIMLSNGKAFTVDPETIAQIQASTYADMGYTEVAKVINELSGGSETLCNVAKSLGMLDRFTAVMDANGLIAEGTDTSAMSANTAANGLQMVTAKYLANAKQEDIDYLLNDIQFKYGTTSALKSIAVDKESGTKTVAAMALQYALVEAYANSDAAKGQTISTLTGKKSVAEYLTSTTAQLDPLAAMAKIQATDAYKNYTTTEQYTNDVNGFIGTMSILGDNLGTVENPGAIGIDGYFQSGINSQDAADALTQVLGQ